MYYAVDTFSKENGTKADILRLQLLHKNLSCIAESNISKMAPNNIISRKCICCEIIKFIFSKSR